MSKELLKNLGLGIAALLVVCNTVQIQGMKKGSRKTREAFSGMRARLGEAHKAQRPTLGPKMDKRGGERPSKRDGSKRGKRQKPEAK